MSTSCGASSGPHFLRTHLEDQGAQVLLVAVGSMAGSCLAAAKELAKQDVAVSVIDPRWAAPLDPALLELAGAHGLVLAVEDTVTTGALGARIAQALASAGSTTCAATFALPPRFLPHGSRDEILRANGLDADGITTTVLKRIAQGHAKQALAIRGLNRR